MVKNQTGTMVLHISNKWLFTTLALMLEIGISEMLALTSAIVWLIT
jgi:hypothetical protein